MCTVCCTTLARPAHRHSNLYAIISQNDVLLRHEAQTMCYATLARLIDFFFYKKLAIRKVYVYRYTFVVKWEKNMYKYALEPRGSNDFFLTHKKLAIKGGQNAAVCKDTHCETENKMCFAKLARAGSLIKDCHVENKNFTPRD